MELNKKHKGWKVIRVVGVRWETLSEEENEHTVPFGGIDPETDEPFDWSTLNGKETDVLIKIYEK
jgi:hypothetical protein